jgi:hypothetical protein
MEEKEEVSGYNNSATTGTGSVDGTGTGTTNTGTGNSTNNSDEYTFFRGTEKRGRKRTVETVGEDGRVSGISDNPAGSTNSRTGAGASTRGRASTRKGAKDGDLVLVNTITDNLELLLQLYAMNKPPALQPVWQIPREELQAVAVPAAKCYSLLPYEVSDKVNTYSAPVALIASIIVVFGRRIWIEHAYNKTARIFTGSTNAGNGKRNTTDDTTAGVRNTEYGIPFYT